MDLMFGDYRLRTRERELVGPAGSVELSAPAFDLLQALLAQPDTLLHKDALFAAAWPGVIVEDNTLQVHISALRKALGPGLITTVHGRGYRYVGPRPQPVSTEQVLVAPGPQPAGNISRYTSDCVARESELAAVATLLAEDRLVTIVGPGGVGKTTLGVAVASRIPTPPGGVWMIDLAAIDNGNVIESTLIQTLGIPFRAGSEALTSIAAHLQRVNETLLVVDNCEHVQADAARVIGTLLRDAPGLRVLATSQVPLGLAQEHVFKLLPFSVERNDGAASSSERFFAYCVERFGEALTAAEQPVAARLAKRLDGVALALKMAAARSSSIGLEAVDRQLEAQLATLAADWNTSLPRHRSLSASLAWSYDLLADEDKRILRALGVFHGSFSGLAIAAVAGDGADGRLSELVRRSLVVRDGVDRTRYRLLDSTRRFTLNLLTEAGELADVRSRHLAFVTKLFADSVETWEHLPDDEWRAKYHPEADNLRAALDFARSRPNSEGYVELASGTSRYFIEEQLGAEGLAVIEEGAALAAKGATPEAAARIGAALGEICRFNAMDIRAREGLLPVLPCLRQSGDAVRYHQSLTLMTLWTIFYRAEKDAQILIPELTAQLPAMKTSKTKAWALVALGANMWMHGDKPAGLARVRAGLAMHRETGNMHGLFRSVTNFTEIVHQDGDTALALAITIEVLPELRRHGSRLQLATQLSNMAAYLYWIGDAAKATPYHAESLALCSRDGSYWHVCTLQNEVEQLFWEGAYNNAALLLGIVDRRISAWPDGRQSTEQMQRDKLGARLSEALGPAEADRLLRQGESLDLGDAEQLIGASRQTAAAGQ